MQDRKKCKEKAGDRTKQEATDDIMARDNI